MFFIKEPVNSITHFIGAVLSAAGLTWMIIKSVLHQNPLQLTSALIFGISMVLLYSASSIYHAVKSSKRVETILRKIDHSMILVLIAGTYTPVCLLALPRPMGLILLAVLWTQAVAGIFFRVFFLNAPRWLYTSFYVLMGWAAVFFMPSIYQNIAIQGFLLLLLGGISYTIGALIYARKPAWMTLPHFGFHEIFHLFILGGSLAHFIMISRYLIIA
jgi:hemolysin III